MCLVFEELWYLGFALPAEQRSIPRRCLGHVGRAKSVPPEGAEILLFDAPTKARNQKIDGNESEAIAVKGRRQTRERYTFSA